MICAQAIFFGQRGGVQRAHDHGFHGDIARFFGFGEARVFVHHSGEQGLIERAPVYSDAYWFLILDCDFDHGPKVVIVLAADADVAGIDAVFGEGAGAVGVFL